MCVCCSLILYNIYVCKVFTVSFPIPNAHKTPPLLFVSNKNLKNSSNNDCPL